MKKKVSVIIVAVLLIVLTYSFIAGISFNRNQWSVYAKTLQSFIDDRGVADTTDFIAVDTSSLKELGRKEKDLVLIYLERNNEVDIIDASFAELQKKGLVGEGNSIKSGMLLSVEEVNKFLNFWVKIEGSRFHSGLGAYGYEATFLYIFGDWGNIDFKMTWIA